MNEKDLETAFGAKRGEWRESQRRVVLYIEYLENKLQTTQDRLALYHKAAADKWLSENLRND